MFCAPGPPGTISHCQRGKTRVFPLFFNHDRLGKEADVSMKKVLLPIDGSARSLRTIDLVKQIYANQDVAITLLMVLPDQMHIDGHFERERIWRKAEQELGTFAALLEGKPVDTALLRGNPGPEIVQFAREKGYDSLVMTRSSRGPLQKLGSVATYIVRNAQFLNLIIMREAEQP